MATTVAQHSVATFTSPVNGTTPIDANTVRGNDNTVRSSYNDHDADPGIHVQSSTLASRPVAGTAGRKWITDDSGVYTLWFDDGTHWHPVSSENIALTVLAGENLVKGDVVKVTGWNNGQDLPEVVKTTSAADTAFAVITATVSSGSMGYATNTGIVQDVNTAAYSVGTILYANGSGGFTSTKPTSGNYQPVAFVLRANASNGVYYVEFSTPRIVERSDNTASTVVLRDASGDFSAGTITATAINATTLDLTNLEVTNIKAKDGTQAIAIADTTGKLTISDGVLLSGLTASQAVFTDGSKNLVSNAITGTGNVVMSASPTLTGTVTAATINATTLGGTLSTAAQTNITSVGTLSSLTVSAKVAANSTGTAISGYVDGLSIGGYDSLGFAPSPGTVLAVGGYRTSQWNAIDFFTSGTAKMRLDTSGNLAVDTDTLYVDATNNRVGVGTSSPVGKVDSVSNATAAYVARASTTGADQTANAITAFNADASLYALARYRAVQHIWDYAGTTEGMRLDSSGNLGLGVTPSAWGSGLKALQIGSLGGASLLGYANAAEIGYNFYFDNVGYKYGASAASTQIQFGAGEIRFKVAPSGTADAAITFTQAMTLDASGRLLLGRTSGTYGLDLTSVDGNLFRFTRSTDELGSFISSNVAFFGTTTSTPLAFMTNSTERARITSGGEWLVGTTTANAQANVDTSTNKRNIQFNATDSSTYTDAIIYANGYRNTTNGTWKYLSCAINGVGEKLQIIDAGTVNNATGTYGTISDERLKQDIVDAGSQWADIKTIRFRKYRMKTDVEANPDAPVLLGVVAQELEQVCPGLVDESNNDDGTTTKTVKSSILLMKAAVALQEAMARIETLEQRVLALEA